MSDRTYDSSLFDNQSNDDPKSISINKPPTPKKRLSKSASLTRISTKSKSSVSADDNLTIKDSRSKIKNSDLKLDLSKINKSPNKIPKKTKPEARKWITVYRIHETTFDEYIKDSKLPPKPSLKKKKRSKTSSTKKDTNSTATSTSTIDKKAELINSYSPSKKQSAKQRSNSSISTIKSQFNYQTIRSQSSVDKIGSTKKPNASTQHNANNFLYSNMIKIDAHSNDHQNFRLFRSLRRDM